MRADLWTRAGVRSGPAGLVLIMQGSSTDRLFVLLEGEATSISTSAHGRSVIVGRWLAPVVIDKVTMLTAARHSSSVTLDEPSTWCVLPAGAVRAAIEGSSSAQGHALASVADAARQARDSFVGVAVRSTTERLATWLLVSADAGIPIRIPRPRDRLALQLGMTRVSLQRALRRLLDEQVIELSGSWVSITDAARLRAIANR